MGIGSEVGSRNWRISSINADYGVRMRPSTRILADNASSLLPTLPFSLYQQPSQIIRSITRAGIGPEPGYLP